MPLLLKTRKYQICLKCIRYDSLLAELVNLHLIRIEDLQPYLCSIAVGNPGGPCIMLAVYASRCGLKKLYPRFNSFAIEWWGLLSRYAPIVKQIRRCNPTIIGVSPFLLFHLSRSFIVLCKTYLSSDHLLNSSYNPLPRLLAPKILQTELSGCIFQLRWKLRGRFCPWRLMAARGRDSAVHSVYHQPFLRLDHNSIMLKTSKVFLGLHTIQFPLAHLSSGPKMSWWRLILSTFTLSRGSFGHWQSRVDLGLLRESLLALRIPQQSFDKSVTGLIRVVSAPMGLISGSGTRAMTGSPKTTQHPAIVAVDLVSGSCTPAVLTRPSTLAGTSTLRPRSAKTRASSQNGCRGQSQMASTQKAKSNACWINDWKSWGMQRASIRSLSVSKSWIPDTTGMASTPTSSMTMATTEITPTKWAQFRLAIHPATRLCARGALTEWRETALWRVSTPSPMSHTKSRLASPSISTAR